MYYGMYTSQGTPSDNVTDFHETLILYVICRANAEFKLIFALAFAVLEISHSSSITFDPRTTKTCNSMYFELRMPNLKSVSR